MTGGVAPGKTFGPVVGTTGTVELGDAEADTGGELTATTDVFAATDVPPPEHADTPTATANAAAATGRTLI